MSPQERKALSLIALFEKAGHEARFVGGCVRDAVMGRAVGDIDLATTARPEEVLTLLETHGIKAVPTGIDHGTITAVMDGAPFEITTLREDVETDGRHARVIYARDWEKDARRRDFTMNALSRDAKGNIHDFVGGFQDAKDGRVCFVGSPRDRIAEDYLRILRLFRFFATHGRIAPDRPTLQACHEAAPHLKSLSRERVWRELKKLLAAPNPLPAFRLAQEAGVLQKILPEAHPRLLEKLLRLEACLPRLAGDPLLRLAALTLGDVTEAEALAARFALSQNEARNLGIFLDFDPAEALPLTPKKLARIAYKQSVEIAGKILLLAGASGAQFDWDSAGAVLEKITVKTFPLKGEDVVRLGVDPGPAVGEILHGAERWWIENDFMPSRAACIDWLKSEIENRKSDI